MKYKYLILFSFLFPPAIGAADNVGRLFFTPDQRAQLDILRARRDPRQPVTADADPVAAAPAPAPPQGPDTVTYNGVVRRSDGKSTVWINGKAVDERNRVRGAHDVDVVGMRADGGVAVVIPQASRVASLKVGQLLEVNSGRIEESYSRRALVIGPTEIAQPAPATASPILPIPRTHTPTPTNTPAISQSALPVSAHSVGKNQLKDADPSNSVYPAERATIR